MKALPSLILRTWSAIKGSNYGYIIYLLFLEVLVDLVNPEALAVLLDLPNLWVQGPLDPPWVLVNQYSQADLLLHLLHCKR